MAGRRAVGRPTDAKDDKRDTILVVAAYLFATSGYEKTTIRLVAQRSGVDPKLVMHYFTNKHQLFISCMQMPIEASTALKITKTLPKNQWGSAIAEIVWGIQSLPHHPLLSLMRAASSDPEAAVLAKEFYLGAFVKGFASELDIDNKELRLMMVSSLVSGFTFSNKVLGIFDAVKISDKKKKELLANAVQNILTSPV